MPIEFAGFEQAARTAISSISETRYIIRQNLAGESVYRWVSEEKRVARIMAQILGDDRADGYQTSLKFLKFG